MEYATPPAGTSGPVGEGNYTVAEGDCIESIAADSGFLWSTLWNHPKNASLKRARCSPNLLLPGDRVFIPEKVLKTVNRLTDKRHHFVLKGWPCKFHICVKWVGVPRRNTPYFLIIDGTLQIGITDDEGWIDADIPPNASGGELRVGRGHSEQVFSLTLGGMDPVTEISGIQKRLANLGFVCEPTGKLDEATTAALASFQKDAGLPPTGEADRATIEQLKSRHAS